MAQFAYPKALTGLHDTEWSHFLTTFLADGVTKSASFQATADGGGMYVDLRDGEVLIQGVLHANDEYERMPIAGANTSPRIDTVVKRLNRENPGLIITTEVLQGSPGGSAPVLTQDPDGIWEWPVADILVEPGSVVVNQSAVTDRRSLASRAPARWRTENRPAAHPDLATPLLGWNSTSGEWEYIERGGKVSTVVPATLPVSRGGTGAKTASAARTNLGAAAASHEHQAWDVLVGTTHLSDVIGTINGNIQGKADRNHTHPWSDITNRPSSYPPSSHTHTAWQVMVGDEHLSNVIGTINGNIQGKADRNHTHDGRYYTKSQADDRYYTKSQANARYDTKSQVDAKVQTRSLKSHTHDDRYYTKSQANARYATSGHSHIARQIGVFDTNVEAYLSSLNARVNALERA